MAVYKRPAVASRGAAEAACNEAAFPALRLARTSRRARSLAKFLLVLLILAIAALGFAPWQQSVAGNGQVVAYAPLFRQQTVQAPTSGRIVRWNERVGDNTRVKAGEFILEIEDLDPNLLEQLRAQEWAAQQKLKYAGSAGDAYDAKVRAYTEARVRKLEAVDQLIGAARQKVRAAEQELEALQAALWQEELDYQRQKRLADKGLASGLERQVAERKFREASAKVEKARADVAAAQNELAAKMAERGEQEQKTQADIDAARAELGKARGEVAIATKDLADIQVKVARQESQIVRAPRDGFVLRLLVAPGAEMVKQGDPLFVLVPDTADRAVELWVDGNDAPLITPGRHVRLQFEGWPAVQFTGWPSVAVGTFGGTVANVDATDSGSGRFRILVRPDNPAEWPSERYLRQGVRANGWVLLNEVTLGYELWRKMNGFPPAVDSDDRKSDASLKKVGK